MSFEEILKTLGSGLGQFGWNDFLDIAILTVLSGVIGNSIDRIWRGEVVDFLDCYINKYHWPAFNVADCAICVGIAAYTLSVLVRPVPEDAQENSADEK